MSTTPSDVIILGSGFSGSLLAMILNQQGRAVVIVDSAEHPRFAIGESTTPAATLLLKEICQRYELPELKPLIHYGSLQRCYPELNAGCKRGFTYFNHAGPQGFQATPAHEDELLFAANANAETADTQWLRSRMDYQLLQMARQRGVRVIESAETRKMNPFESGWELELVSGEHESSQTLRTRFLVDASGGAARLLKEFNVPLVTDELQTNTSALFSHFANVNRLQDWLVQQQVEIGIHPFPAQQAAIHHWFDDGWLWQISFNEELTSLGFVQPNRRNSVASYGPDRLPNSAGERWRKLLVRHPVLKKILGDCDLAASPGQIIFEPRVQRLYQRGVGQNWAALPSTRGIIDPLHSTGIAHSLSGVLRLADILLEDRKDDRNQQLQYYDRQLTQELQWIDLLVSGCYRALPDFGALTAWSLCYFAAATNFEHLWSTQPPEQRGFLCANSDDLVQRVRELAEKFNHLAPKVGYWKRENLEQFRVAMRQSLSCYDRVGLFDPLIKNMYPHCLRPDERSTSK